MDATTRRTLRAINRQFYETEALSFGRSRSRPWPGWQHLLPLLQELPAGIRCLDLGCGNGRFAHFLREEACPVASYLGVDASPGMLAAARQSLPDWSWQAADVDDGEFWANLPWAPNLIVLFGVLHHVPGRANRLELLQRCAEALVPGGLLIYTHWLLDRDAARLGKLLVPTPGATAASFERGDHLLSWQGRKDVPRFCHFVSDEEIDDLERKLPHLRPRQRFVADGPSGTDNLYQTLQKIPT